MYIIYAKLSDTMHSLLVFQSISGILKHLNLAAEEEYIKCHFYGSLAVNTLTFHT